MFFVCRKESPAEEVSAPHSYEDNNMEMHTNPQTISSRLADEWDPLYPGWIVFVVAGVVAFLPALVFSPTCLNGI